MKRFISTFIAALMVCSSIATTAFAAEKNLVLTADKTTVKAGDNVKVLAKLTETTEDVGALQFSITFDPNVFELAEDNFSSISAPPPVLASLQKYVPVEYHQEYQFADYASYYQFGSRQIGSELREVGMTVTFAYAGGVTQGCGLTNKILGGAYLKVKDDLSAITDPTTLITITSPDCSYQGASHTLITNDIEITLDGVGSVEPPYEAYKIDEVQDPAKDAELPTVPYTQGFKATVIPNSDSITGVTCTLSTAGKEDYVVNEWATLAIGKVETTFAINVLNVPAGVAVTAEWNASK